MFKSKEPCFSARQQKIHIMARHQKLSSKVILRVRLHKKWQKKSAWIFYTQAFDIFMVRQTMFSLCDANIWKLKPLSTKILRKIFIYQQPRRLTSTRCQRAFHVTSLNHFVNERAKWTYNFTSKLAFLWRQSLIRLFLSSGNKGCKHVPLRRPRRRNIVAQLHDVHIYRISESEFIYQSRIKLPLSKAER